MPQFCLSFLFSGMENVTNFERQLVCYPAKFSVKLNVGNFSSVFDLRNIKENHKHYVIFIL
jgi:hypothetical protein